jgi:membrane protein DedA with SNARE-associated domain
VFALLLARLHLWLTQTAVLGALVSLDTLKNALTTLGYPAVALFIMIESSGIPFPGETMLLLASFYAGTTNQLNIFWVIVACSTGAILGDNLGYLVGRYGGRPFALRYGKYLFLKAHHLDAAEQFFLKHGDKTVFLGRFVAVLRAWAAFLAGVNRMHWYKFLIYNAAGGICWATIMGLFGYFAGKIIGDNFNEIEHLGQSLGFVALALVILPVVYFIVRARLRKRHLEREAARAKEETTPEEEAPATTVQ